MGSAMSRPQEGETDMALLEVKDLNVEIPTPYGEIHAVRGIDLALERGQTLGIVGESGCGKSLTSLALMGLLPKGTRRTASSLTLDGKDMASMTSRELADVRGSELAMIFQEPMTSLNPAMTVGEQLMEVYRRHRPEDRDNARSRAIHLLDKVGIASSSSRMSQYPHQLSGGLRQRVMIAMALMCSPKVLIADEPTTALDVTIQAQILRLLADLQREYRMGMIFITHDLGVVARIADDVAVMYAGKVVETGPTERLFSNPQHPYTKGLLSCIPRAGKIPPGGRLSSISGTVPNLATLSSTGCAYAGRCSDAIEACSQTTPPLVASAQHQAARCIRLPLPAQEYVKSPEKLNA
jgi:peptide/nickel transport system ATP-binding protein